MPKSVSVFKFTIFWVWISIFVTHKENCTHATNLEEKNTPTSAFWSMTPMFRIPENRIKRVNQLLWFALSIIRLLNRITHKWLASSWRRYNKEPNKWCAFDFISLKLNGYYGDSQIALAIRNSEINDTESKIFENTEQRTLDDNDINCVTSAHNFHAMATVKP